MLLIILFILTRHALAQTHQINGEYIKEWLVLGPFFPDDLEKDFLVHVGGEANIQPQEGNTVTTSEGRTLTWKRYSSKTNIISLLDAIGYHPNATAYAFCVLQSNVTDDFQLYLGYDDGVMVWIDGKLVYSSPAGEIFDVEEDILSPPIDRYLSKANLKVGYNHCLIKVTKFNRIGANWEFAMRILPPECAVISGIIADENGEPIPNADVRLEQDGKKIAQTTTNNSGSYQLGIYPVVGQYDLSVTSNEKGVWRLGIRPGKGEQQNLNLRLKEAINIEGSLLMLDDTTPHVSVPVQAIRNGRGDSCSRPVATTLSDGNGRYRFTNLKPGEYQIRCQILDGEIYYKSSTNNGKMEGNSLPTFQTSSPKAAIEEEVGEILQIEEDKTIKGIDFRFPPFKKGNWKNYTYFDGLAGNFVTAIHHAPDGMMWFATGGGVSRYDGKEFVNFTTKNGLASNYVSAIHCSPDGVMWFATDSGISRYDGKEFVNFTTKDGLADNYVHAIHYSPGGVIWFATNGGVSRYDGTSAINLTKKDGLPNNRVLSLYRDFDGAFWFGTDFGGVCHYNGKNFTNFTTKDGLAGNCVFDIQRDLNGVLWFGVIGGLSRYDGKAFANFTERDGLPHHTILAINCSPDGIIWLGTRGGGVSRYDGKQFVNFTTEDGLAGNSVWSIYHDSNGVLWFGTTRGVSRYDGSEFSNFTTEDGLAHNSVVSIYRDVDGTLWFGTYGGGVSRYDGIAWTSLDVRDGLADNTVRSIHQDEDGSVWFGTYGGIVCHHLSTTPPKVRINSVRIREQFCADLAAISPITVGEYITIRYSSIDFVTIPEKRQYRYRIRDIDSDWRRPTKESHFDWAPTKSGTYTFSVQAIDRDLNYSEPATVELEVIEDPRDQQIAQLESELERRNRHPSLWQA